MALAQLDGKQMLDWSSFHTECANVFGFPPFYGRNMNAWIDCLTYVREGDGMSRYTLGPEDFLTIEVLNSEILRHTAPEIYDALVECTNFVNDRNMDADEKPALRLVFR